MIYFDELQKVLDEFENPPKDHKGAYEWLAAVQKRYLEVLPGPQWLVFVDRDSQTPVTVLEYDHHSHLVAVMVFEDDPESVQWMIINA